MEKNKKLLNPDERQHDDARTKTDSPSVFSRSPSMLPGEAFFKSTKCEIDEDLELFDTHSLNRSHDLIKPQPLENEKFSNFNSISARYPQEQYVSSSNPSSTKTYNHSSIENNAKVFSSDIKRQLPTLGEDNCLSSVASVQNKNVDSSRLVTRAPNSNRSGTKILQTPSGARLPISPLAKNNKETSSSPHEKHADIPNVPSSTSRSPRIFAYFQRNYFESDSEGDSSDSDEEHSFLLAATTSEPVYPEEMESSRSPAPTSHEKSSFFFRRTTSTDNFKKLLMKTSEMPRSARTVSNPARVTIDSLKSSDNNTQSVKSDFKFCTSDKAVVNSNLPSALTETEVLSRPETSYYDFDGSSNFLHAENQSSYCKRSLSHSKDSLASIQSPDKSLSVMNTAVILSSEVLNHSPKEAKGTLGGIARCVSCGVIAQPNCDSRAASTTTIVQNEPASRKCDSEKSIGGNSVNSSTQVTPDKETAPFNVASIDLCQLTALIQSLKHSSDVSEKSIGTQVHEAVLNDFKSASCKTTVQQVSPITSEPQSSRSRASKKTTISRDVGTEMCTESQRVLTPRDKILNCKPYGSAGTDKLYGHESVSAYFRGNRADVGVGTGDDELILPGDLTSYSNCSRSLPDTSSVYDRFYHPHRSSQYPFYRCINGIMVPCNVPPKLDMPNFSHYAFTNEKPVVPQPDHCLKKNTAASEIERHLNLYGNWPRINQNRVGHDFYAGAPFVLDHSDRPMTSLYRPSSYGRYVRDRNDAQSNFDAYRLSDIAVMPEMVKCNPNAEATLTQQQPIGKVNFNNYQRDDFFRTNETYRQSFESTRPNQTSGKFVYIRSVFSARH